MIRKAGIDDPPQLLPLINRFAAKGLMLPRSLGEIYETLRDFFVWEEDGRIIACVALHIAWDGLAEVRSLVVAEEAQGRGIGRRLVEACLEEAERLKVKRVFVLTYMPDYFARLGFVPYAKEDLPHKIWTDCVRCPKFPNCEEEAMIFDLKVPSA